MEFEFDKEMDALLRQMARGETAFAATNPQSAIRNPHLDADEISAFAENALPEKAQQRFTIHLADCERCRKILSNIIALNSEIVPVEETKTVAVAAAIPWYRKLFAYPNLAYTMGALVLGFAVMIGFIVLQNSNQSGSFDMAKAPVEQQSAKGPNAEENAMPLEENQTNMMANTANTVFNANAASVYSSDMMTANTSTNTAPRNSNTSVISNKLSVSSNESPKDEPSREDEATKNRTVLPENNFAAGNVAEEKPERSKEDKKGVETADTTKPATVQAEPSQPTALGRSAATETLSAKARKNARANTETTSVGGKTFRRQSGVWIDAAYKGQATTNISRGTNEYKKLDSGLRSIAENLGGTVVIIWKEKAYRIQ
ncbi:MAG: zf-HC2 domain-containing protein [Acidobacteria bacterium]|nr:zf-HC2 domain-containing protein [Acidobacteriota bacterium]MCA1639683.1 zf-HC2 domain-containing protein [Acidobacteriota bacterium]